jgi:F-type H+-transporting ATPase subunit delta
MGRVAFHGGRWAAVFASASGDNADAAFACLKAMVPPVKTIPGALFGQTASRRLEKMLRESVGAAYGEGLPAAVEYAIRFIVLLTAKNHFHEIDSIIGKIEELLDERRGILSVTAESASPLDSDFVDDLRRRITEKTGAAQVKMHTRVLPELLGGYRLRVGGYYVDASLKGQMNAMKTMLEGAVTAVAAVSAGGGDNGRL